MGYAPPVAQALDGGRLWEGVRLALACAAALALLSLLVGAAAGPALHVAAHVALLPVAVRVPTGYGAAPPALAQPLGLRSSTRADPLPAQGVRAAAEGVPGGTPSTPSSRAAAPRVHATPKVHAIAKAFVFGCVGALAFLLRGALRRRPTPVPRGAPWSMSAGYGKKRPVQSDDTTNDNFWVKKYYRGVQKPGDVSPAAVLGKISAEESSPVFTPLGNGSTTGKYVPRTRRARVRGTCLWWDWETGVGAVQGAETGGRFAVTAVQCEDVGYRGLDVGEQVTFKARLGLTGREAVDVTHGWADE